MKNKKEKSNENYIIAIIVLTTLLIISFLIILLGTRIMSDLNNTIDIQKNTIGVCNVDLKNIEKENEELRKEVANKCENN